MRTRGPRKRFSYSVALSAACLALSTSTSAVEGHFDRTLVVTGPVELSVQAGSGSVTVSAGNVSSVQIHGTIRAWEGWFSGEAAGEKVHYLETHPPIEQHGNTITIGVITEHSLHHNVSISYHLVVPAATRLKSEVGSGRQTVDGIDGPLEISSGSGSIQASNIASDVVASTGSGSIALNSVKGKVRASIGSGQVEAHGIVGSFQVSTGSGNVTLEQLAVANARVNTASGNIALKSVRGVVEAKTASGSISGEGGGPEPWRLETVSGGVTVRVPLNLGFDLHAHSVSGSISTNRPLTLEGGAHQHEIIGKAGKGGFLLDVSTVSGNIHIDWLAGSKPSA
jgi:Toastrack DUF4097